jgi:hypothetical protein
MCVNGRTGRAHTNWSRKAGMLSRMRRHAAAPEVKFSSDVNASVAAMPALVTPLLKRSTHTHPPLKT